MSLWQIILIHLVTFGAIVFVLRKIMYSASFNETKRLQQLNQENAKKAQELVNKIAGAEKQYQEKIAAAENEIRRLRAQAKEETDRLKEVTLSKAKAESERIISQALNTKEKLKEEIANRMKKENIDQSLRLIKDVLSAQNQKLVHRGFINEVVEEIEKIGQGKLQTGTNKGELITSYEIDKAKKRQIETILSQKIGKKITLEKKIDKEVIAGITIKLGNLIIDGSLAGKLKEMAETFKKANR